MYVLHCLDVTKISQGTISFETRALTRHASTFVSNYEGIVNKIYLHYRGGDGVACNIRDTTFWGCDRSSYDLFLTHVSLYDADYVAGDIPHETIVRVPKRLLWYGMFSDMT